MVFKAMIEAVWRLITVVTILYYLSTQVDPLTMDTWVWMYLIPLTGIYWAMIPSIDMITKLLKKQNDNRSK